MKGRPTLQEVRTKLQAFCAARDRSHSEVRTKLLGLQVYGNDLEEIISQLITDGFLNEERFARNYVSGKFRISKWGRNKIIHGLRGKRVPDYCINKGLEEIDEDEYEAVLTSLLEKQLKGSDSFESRQKALASLQRKGYESSLILRLLKKQKDEN